MSAKVTVGWGTTRGGVRYREVCVRDLAPGVDMVEFAKAVRELARKFERKGRRANPGRGDKVSAFVREVTRR